ncbi:hypothetical protein Psyaliredsea_23640 [Psychrobacter alimentarius]
MTVSVKVYTTPICPYCSNAKQLLQSKGVNYEEIGMHDMSSEERQALMKKPITIVRFLKSLLVKLLLVALMS